MQHCEERHGYKRVDVRGGAGVYEISDEFVINVFGRWADKSPVIKQIAASMCCERPSNPVNSESR